MSTAKMIYHAKEDPVYRSVYVDVEAWKEKALPNGEMCRYFYVHGGFREKDIRFSYCLPEKEKFTGRFSSICLPFPDLRRRWLPWNGRVSMTEWGLPWNMARIM